MQYPSELPFASLLAYSARGTDELSQQSRLVRDAIKNDGFIAGTRILEHAAKRLVESLPANPFLLDYFGPDVLLVPVPPHAPFPKRQTRDSLWVPIRLCECIARGGLAADVVPIMERVELVPKSSVAGAGQRPNPPQHFDSTAIDTQQLILRPKRITLVDDVVTRGSTLVGIYPHLVAMFPQATIRCFGLLRPVDDLKSILSPVQGTITYQHGNLHREP